MNSSFLRRQSLLPLVLLALSCADNALEPVIQEPEILRVDAPEQLVAGWPVPYTMEAECQLPESEVFEYTVQLTISGPGLDGDARYLLHDDGSAFAVTEPGPGQLATSGDNVPGDGVFTVSIMADFSDSLGSFELQFDLLRDGQSLDRWQRTATRLNNQAPQILGLELPDTLASGDTLQGSARVVDPNGSDDVIDVQLRVGTGGVMRSWPFTMQDDTLWSALVGPELAVGRRGETTLTVVATDRAGASIEAEHSIVLENERPLIEAGALDMWYRLDSETEYTRLVFTDVIDMHVPSASPEDSTFYQMRLPISDPQGALDLVTTQWEIQAQTNPEVVLTVDMTDENEDGVYLGNFSLVGRPTPYTNTDYDLRFYAADAFGLTTSEDYHLRIHNLEAGNGLPGGPWIPAIGRAAR